MTKYILHGGRVRVSRDNGRAFFEAILKDLGDHPRVMFCFFTRERQRWENNFHERRNFYADMFPNMHAEMTMPENYKAMATNADALVIFGGDDEILEHWAHKVDGFIDSLRTLPAVAGASAGADLLARRYWSADWRGVRQGLGLVPANVITHYGGGYGSNDPRGTIDWNKAEEELQSEIGHGENILQLREGKFVVFEGQDLTQ